ncbi:RmlC-like cupin domain-containing protein [Kockovaella imperatae]|uniref:RmlC-like cupin domain-containing protein n=1 Tax=Kockovaella imperatae TaxID=4999 RepID=A0A1Y1UD51_9TREE|nr:RmlC-like cupin domain-containing protein [Kockovaella imperatae]ORX35467.1 RmlC-like cupin domain-containing protein [Kockovaella imperatae]
MAAAPNSKHVFHLKDSEPFFRSDYGSMQRAFVDSFPILKGRNMSMKRLILEGKGIREPHWHANTPELTYCLKGSALVNITDTHSKFSSFTVSEGQMFYVDSGSLHHIENVSDTEPAEFIICFRSEKPEDFSLGASFGAMTHAVLGNTWNVPTEALDHVNLSTEDRHIIPRNGPVEYPKFHSEKDPHKFDAEGTAPNLKGEVVEVHQAKQSFWPALTQLAMYSIRVEDKGMREPHWHPITAEMGYVHEGMARMTILDPDGSTDTYTLKPGDTYYIPPAYPHQIEVLPEGGDHIHFCIFFDQPMPQDIGFKSTIVGVPHETMASTLGISRQEVDKLEGTDGTPLVVKRVNSVDPVKDWTE